MPIPRLGMIEIKTERKDSGEEDEERKCDIHLVYEAVADALHGGWVKWDLELAPTRLRGPPRSP